MMMGTFWTAVLLTSVAKLLMLKSYHSTDFEVHRNWMAITHSLPMDKWYYEQTSEWTLDYPPFFAYFEWILSYGAKLFDPNMLKVENLNYASNMTVLYQKLTVIVTDVVLALGILECSGTMNTILPQGKGKYSHTMKLFALVFVNGGLFLVDHIHFQYNGFLFGILLLSIGKICKEQYFQGAFLFACLLCLKHIFLYIAPAFGVYLLRTYCVGVNQKGIPVSVNIKNLFAFGGIAVSVFVTAFGPFSQHIPQILKRLFPFQRGLSHAYWAPNIWSGYNSLDLILSYGLGLGKSGATSGLVGESKFALLPQVKPIHTFLITLSIMLPILWKLWKSPSPTSFVSAVTLTAWTSFMFGYHVHEKAILNVLIPFSLIATLYPNIFLLTLISGTVSLFPLLFTPFEIVLKGVIAVFHICLVSSVLKVKLKRYEQLFIAGLIPVYILENMSHFVIPKYPFVPLIIVSDYTFVGVSFSYVFLYYNFLYFKHDSTSTTPSKIFKTEITTSTTRVLRKRK